LGQNRRHLDTELWELARRRKPDRGRAPDARPDHVHQEIANKQVAQMQLKLASSRSPISRPAILYNRFPFKPPALLGVIGWPLEWAFDGLGLYHTSRGCSISCSL